MTTGERRARLLAWYDASRRDLPWRSEADPYRVWLSEVMLQQTQVATVIPYFQRWIDRFPTVRALAEADHDSVMKSWEGLGYYSRARNLHRAVREVADRWGGQVPDDPEAFRSLPGVGRYTAGAVMSIAFGREEPVVDGNVRRVLARWTDDPAPADRDLWEIAGELVRGDRPGDLNQGLMELGATVCTPRAPRCGACPVADGCAAREAGTQLERPAPRRASPLPHEDTAVAVIHDAGRLLLVRRRAGDRLGGLWAFPWAVRSADESHAVAAARAALDGLGLSVAAGPTIASVAHTFTHVRATYHAVSCTPLTGEAEPLAYDACAWLTPSEVTELPLPVAQRRIAAMVLAQTP